MHTQNSHSRGNTDKCRMIAVFTAARHLNQNAQTPAHPLLRWVPLWIPGLLSTTTWTGVGSTNLLIPKEGHIEPRRDICSCVFVYAINSTVFLISSNIPSDHYSCFSIHHIVATRSYATPWPIFNLDYFKGLIYPVTRWNTIYFNWCIHFSCYYTNKYLDINRCHKC